MCFFQQTLRLRAGEWPLRWSVPFVVLLTGLPDRVCSATLKYEVVELLRAVVELRLLVREAVGRGCACKLL